MKINSYDISFLDSENDLMHPSVIYARKALQYLKEGKPVLFLPNKPVVWTNLDPSQKTKSVGTRIFYTGGTSGSPQPIFHDKNSIENASLGLRERVKESKFNAVCCLPLHHVGGWMQIERAIKFGGRVFFCDYHDLINQDLRTIISERWISLVPAQLFELIKSPTACRNLRKASGIFLGGGRLPKVLAEKARGENIPLCPCYGMTETAGMITLLKSGDFLNGQDGVGEELSHVSIRSLRTDNQIIVRTNSLCFRKGDQILDQNEWLFTMDSGTKKEGIGWQIGTRLDRTIKSGGEKVNPSVIEDTILQSGIVEKCIVSGIKDDRWGEKVVVYLVMEKSKLGCLKEQTKLKLKNHEYPKEWNLVDHLPVSEMGKFRMKS